MAEASGSLPPSKSTGVEPGLGSQLPGRGFFECDTTGSAERPLGWLVEETGILLAWCPASHFL